MKKEDLIWLASKAAEKRWSYEELKYGDDLYGHESDVDAVWEYVDEYDQLGSIAFRNKYSDFKLY